MPAQGCLSRRVSQTRDNRPGIMATQQVGKRQLRISETTMKSWLQCSIIRSRRGVSGQWLPTE